MKKVKMMKIKKVRKKKLKMRSEVRMKLKMKMKKLKMKKVRTKARRLARRKMVMFYSERFCSSFTEKERKRGTVQRGREGRVEMSELELEREEERNGGKRGREERDWQKKMVKNCK
ncbi:hypothetical protein RIF29_04787 [Crotalaria pallida]|uniref:Uncharacterized protein n=1 Tax=Crotalaria pallida TaxID=3830 RepID=A0AAN9J1L8_CROPI